MADKKIIAVVGSTGAQGGGLARAILNDTKSAFKVRALTTNVNSDKAKELKRLGAEVVSANVDDQDSLERAFKGADSAYCVTFYWNHMSPDREISNAVNLAKAAKAAGIKHAIWSTFEDTRNLVPLDDNRMPTLMGRFKVPHFDAKAEANHYFTELGVPTTFLLTSFYYENFINWGMEPKKGPDGKFAITFPLGDKKMPIIASEDIGKCAYGIFKRGTEFINKTLGIAGEHLSGFQMAETLTKVLGIEIHYNDVSPDVFRKFGFPGADDAGNMFQFKRDFEKEYRSKRSVEFSRSLNPELQSFETWVTKNKDRIPLK
jgi:uncharacterized protein YbjT (DUF2867 family)